MTNECKEGCDSLDIITLQNDNADLKKQLDAANANVKILTDKVTESTELMKKATVALDEYIAAEKKALLASIPSKSEFKADELKDKPLEELRTISLAIDKVPTGTVKNVRGTGAGLPTRPNITADGKVDPSKSLMGHPKLESDGSIKWVQ
jgi:hypothetical protein